MKYYAAYDETGDLMCVGTVETDGDVIGEITEAEYNALLASIPKPEETMSDIDEALAILSGEVTE